MQGILKAQMYTYMKNHTYNGRHIALIFKYIYNTRIQAEYELL